MFLRTETKSQMLSAGGHLAFLLIAMMAPANVIVDTLDRSVIAERFGTFSDDGRAGVFWRTAAQSSTSQGPTDRPDSGRGSDHGPNTGTAVDRPAGGHVSHAPPEQERVPTTIRGAKDEKLAKSRDEEIASTAGLAGVIGSQDGVASPFGDSTETIGESATLALERLGDGDGDGGGGGGIRRGIGLIGGPGGGASCAGSYRVEDGKTVLHRNEEDCGPVGLERGLGGVAGYGRRGADRRTGAAPHLGKKSGTIIRGYFGKPVATCGREAGDLDFGDDVGGAGCGSKERIRRTVRNHLAELRYCYEKSIQRAGRGEPGELVVEMSLAPDGKLLDATVLTSSVGDRVASCSLRKISRWQFPELDGYVTVRYPFRFRPAEPTTANR